MTAAMFADPEGRALVAAIHEGKRKADMSTTDQLAAIEARIPQIAESEMSNTEKDRRSLLALVREQAAKLEAVRELHKPVDGAMYGGAIALKVQVCTGCGQDDGNWQRWPCPTITALGARDE